MRAMVAHPTLFRWAEGWGFSMAFYLAFCFVIFGMANSQTAIKMVSMAKMRFLMGFSWVSIWLCVSASLFFLLKTIFLLLCYSFESLLFCFRCFLLSLPFPCFMLFHRFAAFFLPRFPAAWPLCFHLLILSSLTFMLSCFPAFVP